MIVACFLWHKIKTFFIWTEINTYAELGYISNRYYKVQQPSTPATPKYMQTLLCSSD